MKNEKYLKMLCMLCRLAVRRPVCDSCDQHRLVLCEVISANDKIHRPLSTILFVNRNILTCTGDYYLK